MSEADDRSVAPRVEATYDERATIGPNVPSWLSNGTALGWRVLAVAALGVVLWYIASLLWTVTASIAVAIVISAVFAPMVLRLRARGRSRNAAAGMVWATAILSTLAILLALSLAFMPSVRELASRIEAGLSELQAQFVALQLPPRVDTLVQDGLALIRDLVGEAASGLVDSAAGAVTVAILATILIFFFLRDGDKAWLWLFQSAGARKRERITAAGDVALGRVGGYLRGTTLLSAVIALTDLAFMWLLDVPLAVPLAVLVFLAGYVPYFGGIISTAVILIVSLASVGTGSTLLLLLLMGLRSVAVGYFLRPVIYSRTVDIHPALVLIALPMGYELAGIVGLFAAVPVTAVILAVTSAALSVIQPVPAPPLPTLVPAWLDQLAQWAWRILILAATVALFVAVLVTLPVVVIPIVLALILGATLVPLVSWLVKRGYSRGRAAAAAVGGSFLLITSVMLLALLALVDQAGELGDTAVSGAGAASDATGGQLELGVQAVQAGTAAAVRTIVSLGEQAASVATITLIGILLAFYGLRDGGRLWGRVIAHVDPAARQDLGAAASRAVDVLGGYMIGTAAISIVGAGSQLVIMVLLGLPLALPIFVLSFFLCFIPYIGGFISTGIALLVAIAVGSTTDVVVMGIWTVVFNIVQGNVVSPLVYGRTVHIHPAIVLVAIPAGSAVAGVLGMFIVIPAIGVVAGTWRTVFALMDGGRGQERVGTPASDMTPDPDLVEAPSESLATP